jgi:hypothetical protein
MNTYTSYHVLNGHNDRLFASSKYNSKTGVVNAINMEDDEGRVDTVTLPIRLSPSYTNINGLIPYDMKELDAADGKPFFYFQVDANKKTLATSRVKVALATFGKNPPNPTKISDLQKQINHAVDMMRVFVPDPEKVPNKLVALSTFSTKSNDTLTKLKKRTGNLDFFRVFETLDRPFEIAKNLNSSLKIAFASLNHHIHAIEFRTLLNEIMDSIQVNNNQNQYNEKELCYRVFLNIIDHADYSNYPASSSASMIPENILINEFGVNNQMRDKNIVTRVLFTAFYNYQTEFLRMTNIATAQQNLLRKDKLDENTNIMVDFVERTTATMTSLLFDEEIYRFLFFPNGFREEAIMKILLENDKQFTETLTNAIGRVSLVLNQRDTVFIKLAVAPVFNQTDQLQVATKTKIILDKTVLLTYIIKTGLIKHSMAMRSYGKTVTKTSRDQVFLLQQGMRNRIMRMNWWQRKWIKSPDMTAVLDHEFACAVHMVSRLVRAFFEHPLKTLEDILWHEDDINEIAKLPMDDLYNVFQAKCRMGFSFDNLIDGHLSVLEDMTKHTLMATISNDYQVSKIESYVNLFKLNLSQAPFKLRNLVNSNGRSFDNLDEDSINAICLQKKDYDFIRQIMVDWIGFPADVFNEFLLVIKNHPQYAEFSYEKKAKDLFRFAYMKEPYVYFTDPDHYFEQIHALSKPDFYVFYLFYRILFKAGDDVMLRLQALGLIKIRFFKLFTEFQELIHNYSSRLSDTEKFDTIDNVVFESMIAKSSPQLTSFVTSELYNPVFMLAPFRYDNKREVLASAVNFYIHKNCKHLRANTPVEDLDMSTLVGLISGVIVNSGNMFFNPLYMGSEHTRKAYSDKLGYVNSLRVYNKASLMLDKLKENMQTIDTNDTLTVERRVHPDPANNVLELAMCVEFEQNLVLNGDEFTADWIWIPCRSPTTNEFFSATANRIKINSLSRLSVHKLSITVADGLEGTYIFVFGSPKFGYIRKSVRLLLQLKCVRTGRWYEEITDNQVRGNLTWVQHSPYVFRGWFSAYSKLPYASMLPPTVTMLDVMTRFDQTLWNNYIGDVLVNMTYLADIVFKQIRLWITHSVFNGNLEMGLELVNFLFYLLAVNNNIPLSPSTGTFVEGPKFDNAVSFVSFYAKSLDMMANPIRANRMVYTDMVNIAKGLHANDKKVEVYWKWLKSTYPDVSQLPLSTRAKQLVQSAYGNPLVPSVLGLPAGRTHKTSTIDQKPRPTDAYKQGIEDEKRIKSLLSKNQPDPSSVSSTQSSSLASLSSQSSKKSFSLASLYSKSSKSSVIYTGSQKIRGKAVKVGIGRDAEVILTSGYSTPTPPGSPFIKPTSSSSSSGIVRNIANFLSLKDELQLPPTVDAPTPAPVKTLPLDDAVSILEMRMTNIGQVMKEVVLNKATLSALRDSLKSDYDNAVRSYAALENTTNNTEYQAAIESAKVMLVQMDKQLESYEQKQ